jgi:bla regulator protein blaR1
MIPAYFSVVANHLWQSTVFAGIAGLLAAAMRNNHARTRHWLWLTASVKFLIPFSLLAGMGSWLGSLTGISAGSTASRAGGPELSVVIEQIGRPFPALPAHAAASAAATLAHDGRLLPALLLALWACGFLIVALSWWRRWRGVRAAVRAGSPLDLDVRVPALSSPAMLEPGVFGIFRPVLLLPQGITDRLAPAHLEAIVAHELCHVRRRDNLAAAIHMAVEAIFWFHPLVWWMGARLVEERERACDEEVLRLGSQPDVYAESILKTCQFYLESPLVCMSGISGSDLKKRIVRIMTQRAARKLDFGKKLLLAAAGTAAIAAPIMFGLMNAPHSRAQSPAATDTPPKTFDVASIKPDHGGTGLFRINAEPGRFVADNATVKFLLQYAYHVKESQISGAPGWTDAEHFDIEAKSDDSSGAAQPRLDRDAEGQQLRQMLQALLADRFKLTLHHETKELPIYELVVAKNGSKLHESPAAPDDSAPPSPLMPNGPQPRHSIRMMGRGDLSLNSEGLDMFAELLSRQPEVGRVVVNKTGLKGNYDFTLKWTPDPGQGQMLGGPGGGPSREAAPPPDANGPTIFTALQEQLGLKLESQKGPVDTLVIDHIERPSEN